MIFLNKLLKEDNDYWFNWLGEMGSEIGRYLVMNDLEVISVYEGRSDLSKKRASKYKIRDAGSIEKFRYEIRSCHINNTSRQGY